MKKKSILLFSAAGLLAAALTGCSGGLLEESPETETPESGGGFVWTKAEDVETRRAFLRNFGVGYSYDAVRGSYCNYEDIRCQVLNRTELERQTMLGDILWVSHTLDNFASQQQLRYSQRDYVASLDLRTSAKVNLGLYNGEKRTRQYVLEEGLQDCFYYMTEDYIEKGEQYIIAPEIMEQVNEEENENLLTQSFLDAIEHLAWADAANFAVVDSFLNVWGTHVITRATLGGTLQLTLKNDMWRYQDIVDEQEFTSEQIMLAYNNRKESRTHDERYTWTEQSSLYINVRGGDMSLMGGLIGEAHYDGTRNFEMGDVYRWRESITFNPADEEASNCEMVSMEVAPIWDFVPSTYPHVARRLRAAILQDVSLLQESLGDRNFFATSFPVRFATASCQWRRDTGSWQTATRTDSGSNPMVVNIVSGGRYVATVCHEQVDGQWLWVCYPIYEGKVKLACGVGVADDNRVYDVRWINGSVKTSLRSDAAATGTFFINGGEVDVTEQEGITYAAAYVLPYVELSGGVRPDGSYAATAYPVTKSGSDFELLAPKGRTDIVGFTDSGVMSGSNARYRRSADYVYIYNQNELKYN